MKKRIWTILIYIAFFFFYRPTTLRSYSLVHLVDKNEIEDVTLLVFTELPMNDFLKYVKIIIRFTTVTIIPLNIMLGGLWIIESIGREHIQPGKCSGRMEYILVHKLEPIDFFD